MSYVPTHLPLGRPAKADPTRTGRPSPRIQVRLPFSVWLYCTRRTHEERIEVSSLIRTLLAEWLEADPATAPRSPEHLHPAARRMERGRPWRRDEDPDVPFIRSQPLPTRLDETTLARLDATLEGTGISRSLLVRHLLYGWLQIPEDWQETPDHFPHWVHIDPHAAEHFLAGRAD